MPIPVSRTVKRNAALFLVIAGAVLWVPVAQLMLGNPPRFLRDLGFLSGPRGTPLAWSLGMVMAVLYAAYAIRNIPLVREHWRALSLMKLLGLLLAVAAAVVEEAFFRRMLMNTLMRAGWPVITQVVASGLVFGIAHASWALVTGRLSAGIGAMVATGALGTGLGLVFVLGDRSLAPVIVAHFVVTATIQPGIMFAAFSGQMRQPVPPPVHAAPLAIRWTRRQSSGAEPYRPAMLPTESCRADAARAEVGSNWRRLGSPILTVFGFVLPEHIRRAATRLRLVASGRDSFRAHQPSACFATNNSGTRRGLRRASGYDSFLMLTTPRSVIAYDDQ